MSQQQTKQYQKQQEELERQRQIERTQDYPFINQMLRMLGIPERK
ncbi:hypothetical protein PUG46_19365 [Erwiniaceae bacterium L1_55_4]|nr:hypothetical protein [Erwiniaceae bacterium L1_55_4]